MQNIPPICVSQSPDGSGVQLTLASGHSVQVPLLTRDGNPHAAGVKTLLSILALHEASHATPNPKRIAQHHTPVAHLIEQAIAAGGLRAFASGSRPKQVLTPEQAASIQAEITETDFSQYL